MNYSHNSFENLTPRTRHAGAVNVRGMMIRRWRPRFLELDENGVLRYYEATENYNSMTHHQSSIAFSAASNQAKVRQEKEQQQRQQQQQHALKGVGSGSNKDFVHISNDDIMNREMQAFSLPKEFQSETHVKSLNIKRINHKRIEKNNEDDDKEKNENNNGNNYAVPETIEDLQFDDDDDDDSGEVITRHESQEVVVTKDMHVRILSNVLQGGKEADQNTYNNNNNEGQHQNEIVTNDNETMNTMQYQAQDLHHHVHKHRAKAVMTILSARIIDVNSLRDIHVGLPKGTYGFVFCGRQIFSNLDNNNSFGIMDHEDPCEIRDDVCHPLSILSSDHDYFDTSRDYLCSVNTLEEAHQWVSALRWAANLQNTRSARQRLHPSSEFDPYMDDNSFSSDSSIDRTISVESIRSVRSPPRTSAYLSGLRRNCNLLETSQVEDDQSVSTGEHIASPSRSDGITLVTKVTDFVFDLKQSSRGLPRLRLEFEIKYKVKMLVLHNFHLNNRSRKRMSNCNTQDLKKIWNVEERTIFRSHDEFIALIEKLSQEQNVPVNTQGDKDEIPHLIQEARNRLSQHPDQLLQILNFVTVGKKMNENVGNTNKVLRSFATDCRLCNTAIIKDFLLKDNETSKPSISQSFFSVKADYKTYKEVLEIPTNSSIDDFVKKWLFHDCSEERKSLDFLWKAVLFIIQNPIFEYFAVAIIAFLSYGSYMIWSKFLCKNAMHRYDVLLVKDIVIFYLGFVFGSRYNKHRESRASLLHDKPVYARKVRKAKRFGSSKQKDSFAVVTTQTKSCESLEIEEEDSLGDDPRALSSPLPEYSPDIPSSSWSRPKDNIFKVRGKTYLKDRIKIPSDPSPMKCRGIDMWITDNPERNISRHPSVLGGKLNEEDTFIVNFLLPFGNFVTYFSVPPINEMPKNLASVWSKFVDGNQQYRDARLKLLPFVVDGPWIVKKAVGNGPALLGQAIPLQYYFTPPSGKKKGVYEVDVIITASRLAKGILNVVKSHTKRLTLAIAFIIEAAKESELPETVLCSCQIHSLHLELCPDLPKYFLDDTSDSSSV